MGDHPSVLLSGNATHELSRNGQTLSLRVAEIGGTAGRGHLLVFGDPNPDDSCLVRIHSRCLYGEMLRSDDCDCGPELDISLDLISNAGSGVLIYLEQEGRGMGLLAKARGYRYSQEHRVDTFTAYKELGFPADARTYTHAVESLRELGFSKIRLLTNNPEKIAAVREGGMAVAVEHLHIRGLDQRVRDYLEAKRRHRRHMIPRLRILVDLTSLAATVLTMGFIAAEHWSASMAATTVAALTTAMRLRDSTHAVALREMFAGIPIRAATGRVRSTVPRRDRSSDDRGQRDGKQENADSHRQASSCPPEVPIPDLMDSGGLPQLDDGPAQLLFRGQVDNRPAKIFEGGPRKAVVAIGVDVGERIPLDGVPSESPHARCDQR